jgi:mRNA-degrading endonuclease RelE of RelBE toxin-antitoxin system
LISRGLWTVLAVYSDEERCDVLKFADQLERVNPNEHARLLRAFERLSASGPSRNVRRSRPLAHGIFELKTQGGVRVPYFFDEGRVVVCSEALPKPKSRGLAVAIERAARTRWRYLNDKRRGALPIMEDQ